MLYRGFTLLMVLAAVALALITLLPVLNSPLWWIRAMEFPRVHLVILLAVLLVPAWFLPAGTRGGVMAVLLACLLYQSWRILPYTPLVAKEVQFAAAQDPAGADATAPSLTALSLNVLMENRSHDAVADLIAATDPDILFLMETDQAWIDALDPVLARYDTVLRHPGDDHYGLVFATRLRASKARVMRLTTAPTPSVLAELAAPDGRMFNFVGLHPRPPIPGVDTQERDDQLVYSARFARAAQRPVLVMGDFNAVAWSNPSQRFKRVGGYLDPRIGRAPLPSFDAKHPVLRLPIDQVYITPDIVLETFTRGPKVGSDHFPIIARFRIDPDSAQRLNRRPVSHSPALNREIETRLERHRARLDEAARLRGSGSGGDSTN